MFMKRDDPAPATPAAPSTHDVSPQEPDDESATSLIGVGLQVTGTIRTEGTLHIDGTVEGEIRANLLTIGPDAAVHGDIFADDVVISGEVNGSIRGDRVRLSNTAVVEGEIIHNHFAIEMGAKFGGTVQHLSDPLDRDAAPAEIAWTEPEPPEVPDSGADDTDLDEYPKG